MAARAWRGLGRVASFATGTWTGRGGVVLVAAHQYDTHFKYARFNR